MDQELKKDEPGALAKRDESGRLQRGHHMGRRSGSSLIERFRELVAPDWPDIVAQLVLAAKLGDTRAAELIAARMVPAPRPVQPRVVVPGLAEARTLEDKARAVIDAGAQGVLGPDEVDRWLATLANMARIIDATVLEKRIAELERQLGRAKPGAALDAEPIEEEPLV